MSTDHLRVLALSVSKKASEIQDICPGQQLPLIVRVTMSVRTRDVHMLIFDDVEVLDFCGPFEVFSVAGRRHGIEPFQVYTVAPEPLPVTARGGLSINPNYSIADAPEPDLLLVPGGPGTRALIQNEKIIDWVKHTSKNVEIAMSVCSGALVLGRAGLLDGLKATTHCGAIDELRSVAPTVDIRATARVLDNGNVVVSAGVSAGIDLALHVVARLIGRATAIETACYIEYDWSGSATNFDGKTQ